MIILGQRESDNIIPMITISDSSSGIKLRAIWDLANMGQFDHINQMITLSVITLSGFHCTHNFIIIPISKY